MELLTTWTSTALPLTISITALWFYSLLIKNSSIIDLYWGCGFAVTYWYTYLSSATTSSPKSILLGLIITVWALRLTIYLYIRMRGKGEDPRYIKFRNSNPTNYWWRSLITVFMLQATLIWILSAPLVITQLFPGPITLTIVLGALIWLSGFIIETTADIQLYLFKNKPSNQGKILTKGLWSLSRHPNYLGDVIQWWGFWLVALTPEMWWFIYSPVLMSIIIIKFSGIPILEKSLARTKASYQQYANNVPAFLPNFKSLTRKNK
ncbi:MAG TPA: hypothetical protein DGM69_02240 [Chloroflexi bacterium]|nr:hypothetical protein [Chloroflexota bacterium]